MTENKRLFVGRKTVEDRFTLILDYDDEIGVKENRSGDVIVLKHNDLNAQQFVAQLVVFLNDQNQSIVDLYEGSKYWSDKATEKIKELEEENEQLKQFKEQNIAEYNKLKKVCNDCKRENEQLKQQKPFLKIHNDYFIQYGDDGELFSLHKPSDIRSLMYLLNRENGYSELQCQYNDLEMQE